MNIQNRNLIVIICLIVLMTACSSNQAKVTSATEDRVIVKAPPQSFVAAYNLATDECGKNTATAKYFTDETTPLGEVAFNCIAPEVTVEPVAEAETQTEEAVSEPITEIDAATVIEDEIEPETLTEPEIEEIIPQEN